MENGNWRVREWKTEIGKWKSETRSGMAPIGHGTVVYCANSLSRLRLRVYICIAEYRIGRMFRNIQPLLLFPGDDNNYYVLLSSVIIIVEVRLLAPCA